MKPGDLVFMQYDGDADHSFKAGDTGLIVARDVLPHPGNQFDNMFDVLVNGKFDVLVNGKIEYLFDYEMVLVDGAERLPIY